MLACSTDASECKYEALQYLKIKATELKSRLSDTSQQKKWKESHACIFCLRTDPGTAYMWVDNINLTFPFDNKLVNIVQHIHLPVIGGWTFSSIGDQSYIFSRKDTSHPAFTSYKAVVIRLKVQWEETVLKATRSDQ